ncbi:MAG: ABC transporter permease [Gemmatimonadetes bacterium]|uniref:ABC transporter permease n=1 Tax=Candidatus Kutchimonas denitrificans TaxID=3056748 RepID=A0AAE4Z6A5_9BACT|nr:ABC transporter permease [Gemmatimonadota bacterium]NIR73512.1 ABC transporter permease [Candidatus Kutchimonas denitrificans]NIR99471.1 ABC transporter permease [Gemmatimonadota bacterium]NIT65091.1 ABC transporter permease [Gemmatimonadota bacterium]NIV23624.1 FtsX-like permease family protein [Gemmatimonadota bacterium]
MGWLHGIRSRLRPLLFRATVEAELDEEIAFHVERQAEEYVRAGMPAGEAREAALRAFGRVDAVKEGVRIERGTRLLEDTGRDFRYALRKLRRNPGFTVAAVLTLALGIGANTAVFSVVNAVLLQPLPYAEPDRLVLLWNRSSSAGAQRMPVAAPDVAVYRERAKGFERFGFTEGTLDLSLSGREGPLHVRAGRVDPTFFHLLGVRPALGRGFSGREDVLPPEILDDSSATIPPAPVMLSHGMWKARFGGTVDVLGRDIRLNGQPAVVVGVLPADFELLLPPDVGVGRRADLWLPIRVDLSRLQRVDRLTDQDSDNTGAVIGRLRPGVTLEQAQAEMDGIAARLREEVPEYRHAGLRIDVVPMKASAVEHTRRILLALWAAVGAVLVIACLNVGNLSLARMLGRSGEIALRSALGANRWRLARQMLTESVLLAALGAGLGLLVAGGALPLIRKAGPADLPRLADAGIDGAALAFTLGCLLLATLFFGLAPALSFSRDGAGGHLVRRRGVRAADRHGRGIRNTLVVCQVGLSLTLLITAGLLLRSLLSLGEVSPGFEPRRVLTFELSLRYPDRYLGPADRAAFVHQLEGRLASLPGVEAVGLVGRLPLAGDLWTQPYGLDGASVEEWSANEADFRMVTSGYFRAMGIRLLAGRHFTEAEDLYERERVAIIDERMATRLGGTDGNALGKRLGFPLDGAPVWARVVGIVEHVRHESLTGNGRETIYVPYRQEASREFAVVMRTSGDPSRLVGPARDELRAFAAHLPMYDVRTMTDYIAAATSPTRFALGLIGLFALLALFLATLGLYGVMSYAVRQRRREFGIRMALGAPGKTLIRTVVASGLTLTGIGIGLGLAMSFVGSRFINSMLYNVGKVDPLTYSAVTSLMVLVAALACYVPARRATRVDPAETLRHEI